VTETITRMIETGNATEMTATTEIVTETTRIATKMTETTRIATEMTETTRIVTEIVTEMTEATRIAKEMTETIRIATEMTKLGEFAEIVIEMTGTARIAIEMTVIVEMIVIIEMEREVGSIGSAMQRGRVRRRKENIDTAIRRRKIASAIEDIVRRTGKTETVSVAVTRTPVRIVLLVRELCPRPQSQSLLKRCVYRNIHYIYNIVFASPVYGTKNDTNATAWPTH
jgi:hypothetical protein